MPLSEKPRKHYKPIEPNPPDPVTGKEFGTLTEGQLSQVYQFQLHLLKSLVPALQAILSDRDEASLLRWLSPGISWAKYYEKPFDQTVFDLARVMGQTSTVHQAGLAADPQEFIMGHTQKIQAQLDQHEKEEAFALPIQIAPENEPEFLALLLSVVYDIISHTYPHPKPMHERILEVRNLSDLKAAQKAALSIVHIDPTAVACPSIMHLYQLAVLKRDTPFLKRLATAQIAPKAPSPIRNLYFALSLMNEAGSIKPSPKRLEQLMVDRLGAYARNPDAQRLINEKALKIMKKRTSVHV